MVTDRLRGKGGMKRRRGNIQDSQFVSDKFRDNMGILNRQSSYFSINFGNGD